jgi:hypothetical protein
MGENSACWGEIWPLLMVLWLLPTGRGQAARHQIPTIKEWRLADTLLPKMVPDKFIWIELRCVSGQKVQFQATLETLNVVGNNFGDVCRMAIEDKEDTRQLSRLFHAAADAAA